MNILLLYASNSGSTQSASQLVEQALTASGHTVTMKNPKDTTLEEINGAACIVLASPSWDYETQEGQPHEDFLSLRKQLEGKTLESKPFAILGLGDTSYTHFCGAVDAFEALIQNLKGKLVIPSLRIDRFYQKSENSDLVTSWAQQLASALKTL